jgi:hypothetical protein
MHQAAIKSLELVEDNLRQHSLEKKSTYYEDQGKKSRKYQSSQSQSSDSSGDENCKARVEDARNIITQKKVNKARLIAIDGAVNNRPVGKPQEKV